MKERLSYKGEKKVYNPRIRETRIHDLHAMKEFTRKPMTVLVDEALSIYLANFMTSPEYTAFCEQIEKGIDELTDREPNNDDYEDLGNYLDNYS